MANKLGKSVKSIAGTYRDYKINDLQQKKKKNTKKKKKR